MAVAVAIWGGFSIVSSQAQMQVSSTIKKERPMDYPIATFAGGCFWCLESEFRTLEGIFYTSVGYSGGDLDYPTYKDVTTGRTGHAEAIEITYDPDMINYRQLVEHFLQKAHDPTQLNRQGVDMGPQYRSVIFFHNDEQQMIADAVVRETSEAQLYDDPIVTELLPAGRFWVAEEYHQQYYEKYQEETGRPHIRVLLKQQKKMEK